MNVLMIATEKLPVPPVRGGAIQTYIAAVAPLLARDHTLTLLSCTDPDLPGEESTNGVRFVRIRGGDLTTYAQGVVQHLAANRYDLIHLFNRPRLVRSVRDAAPETPIVLSMHNDMFGPEKIDGTEAAEAVQTVSRIITVSDYVGRTLAAAYPEAEPKRRTIYSGVDLNRFTPVVSSFTGPSDRMTLRKEHGLEDRKVILFVGRLSPKKGADVLVRAMPLLESRQPNAALVLVGSKWYSDEKVTDYVGYVRSLAARSPLPVVTTGFVAPQDVHRWFWVGDLFVCPSLWPEPLARVHYEAMAAGLPIITTDRGGNAEVVRGFGNGVLVEKPEEPASFAEAIDRVLSDPKQATAMGKKGRQLAEERFTWNRVAQEIGDVWTEVAMGREGGSRAVPDPG